MNTHTDDKKIFGFWIYILSDCVLFGTLFATHAVLRSNTYGGPGPAELFSLRFVLLETVILLTSSFTGGLAILSAHRGERIQTLAWLGATALLGLAFIGLELSEFMHLYAEGHDWTQSAFLSAFFTLVGTHGAHVAAGTLWLIALRGQVYRRGLAVSVTDRLVRWSLFWHFLDIVWIFIFSFVYLLGIAV